MKNYLCTLGLVLLSIIAIAQTKNNKLGLTAGYGFQKYYGDLGNDFTRFRNTTWYGVASVNLGYYINTSFEIGIAGTIGDYGFCQPDKNANKEIDFDERCPGCIGRTGLGNLNSRMVTGGVLIKYKFANGYLLKESAKIKPYIYIGASVNRITDIMKMECINPGNYSAINAGLGLRYDINARFNVGYNIGMGYFTSDRLDFMTHHGNDMSMQNSVVLGINF